MVAFGWVERDGDQRPFVLRGDQRLEVGQRYLSRSCAYTASGAPTPSRRCG
jgi:hypothetical protein